MEVTSETALIEESGKEIQKNVFNPVIRNIIDVRPGETIPLNKKKGSKVSAGTSNGKGISGDQESAVEKIADSIGITSYHVCLKPDDQYCLFNCKFHGMVDAYAWRCLP